MSFSHQSAYYQDLDGYSSDDLDESDGNGAALVEYAGPGLLDPNMDVDSSFSEAGSELDYSSESDESGGSSPDSALDDANTPLTMTFMGTLPQPLVPPAVPNPPGLPLPFEQLAADATGQALAAWYEGTHPVALSNPNPTTIGPSNYGLTDFLHHWARQSRILHGLARGRCPWPAEVNDLASSDLRRVSYNDLQGDGCDFQGVNWKRIGVTRSAARERRLLTYSNYVNVPDSDRWTVSLERHSPFLIAKQKLTSVSQPNLPDVALPRSEAFFRFRCMDIRHNVNLSHFQLRNVLATTSRSRAFYPGMGAVHQFNPTSGHGRAVIRLSDAVGSQISALDAGHGVLVAGSFHGEYFIRHLDSGEPESEACRKGIITNDLSGITNHVRVHQARTSSAPLASLASNDKVFRVLDLATETWLSEETFDFPLNCSALSPDGRLRVMVGDSLDVLITAAESTVGGGRPEIFHRLPGHRDYGFACDWADNGWTIATAFQDKAIKIWDARWLADSSGASAPVCTIRSEMAGVRSLKFSPVGSGKRVLVAAEEADFINIIDAETFRSKQTVDVFGELGGVAFANGGQDLMVLCCDHTRGGILQLERCGLTGGDDEDEEEEPSLWDSDDYTQWRRGSSTTRDWPRSIFTERRRIASRRHGSVASKVEIEPF
jgi:WD40 repeat protein